MFARSVEHPGKGRALEQQRLDAERFEGVERLDRRRVELGLVAEAAGALDELIELGAPLHVSSAPERPARAWELSATAEA